jgi:ribosomal protein L19E
VIYLMGRRSGYQAGRLDEREEWATRIRQIDRE